MNRRTFLQASTAAFAIRAQGQEAPRPKAPFRVLYSNDTTNVSGCVSPFHKAGERFRPEMLEASVDEASGMGVDVQLLQPGLGAVPMWPSQVLPLAEHYHWMEERFGVKPDVFGQYVMQGGDVVKVFIDRCHQRGQTAFVSFRLNDVHHKEYADIPKGGKIGGGAAMGLTRFYVEHPEYRLGKNPKRAMENGLNWAIPEVRAQAFALMEELCQNYDLDGLELDFMRFYNYFALELTNSQQRREIITAFIAQTRALLDRTRRAGRPRRWLAARLPCYEKVFDPMGIDLPAMVAAGLDIITLSASYFTVQQTDLAAIRRQIPQAALYLELCHSIWNGAKLVPGYDTFTFRRATREQCYTAAHLAYARGADGVSAFNFAYYREHGGAGRGPFHEPPFDIFKGLRDPAWLAEQPQHYFLAPGWDNPFIRPPILPRRVDSRRPFACRLDLAPPSGGWKKGGRLRMEAAEDLAETRWKAMLNGEWLTPVANVSEPYPNPDPPMLGQANQRRAWQVPAALLRDGINELRFEGEENAAATVEYLDLAVV